MKKAVKFFVLSMLFLSLSIALFGSVLLNISMDKKIHHSHADCAGALCGPVEHVVQHTFILSHYFAQHAPFDSQSLIVLFDSHYQDITLSPLAPPPRYFS